jgi:excinuclease UvrABC nuclease subunit
MAIQPGQPGYSFSAGGILSAPHASGVYALFNPQGWVYVGESDDIQRRLGQHLGEQGTCIKQQGPTAFQFDLAPAAQRVAVQNQLIEQLMPACNHVEGPSLTPAIPPVSQ